MGKIAILRIPKLLSLLTLNTIMKETTKPNYYQQCSPLGRELLEKAEFPEEYKEYLDGECIDFIEDILHDNFKLGNAFKYIWRLGQKKNKYCFWLNSRLIKSDRAKAFCYLTEYCLELMGNDEEDRDKELSWLTEIALQLAEDLLC
jgi:hypothetical protein